MNVKLYLIAISCAIAMSMTMEARTVRDFFAEAPIDQFLSLTDDTRLDMLDYYEAGQQMPLDNNFDGTAIIDTLATDYMRITTSASSHTEMLLATSKRDTVIYVVSTYLLPAADSRVTAYNTRWGELDTDKYFDAPQAADFIAIPKGDKTRRDDVARGIKIPTIQCSITGGNTLTARPTFGLTMSVEDFAKVEPYLVDSLTYQLKGVKFKLQKQ